MPDKNYFTAQIKSEAKRLGFDFCGISRADFLEEEAPRLEKWLSQNMQGKMNYMANHFDKRLDPRKLVDGAKSVISLLYNYYTDKKQGDPDAPKVSMYALGKDYHFVIKQKLKELLFFIRSTAGEVNGRVFIDSAPVLDRAWAKKSGMGWIGKNTQLINPKAGSYFFIAELILDLELEYDAAIQDYCGTCTLCIDACPTEAIVKPYVVDGSKCISYFTIELKEEIPADVKGKFSGWAFGCDSCQEACPWNRFSTPHKEKEFEPKEEFLQMKKSEWMELTEETFRKIFKDSAVKRAGYKGLKRNINFLKH